MTHHTAEAVQARLDRQPGQPLVIVLGASDSAWNPASTKHDVPGPATLTYRQHVDGGIELRLTAAPQVGPRPARRLRNTAPRKS